MFVFVFLIILSIVLYFYYKTKQFRTALPIRKKWYASTASMFLGSFLVFFGINQLVSFSGAVTYIISGVFIVLGLGLIVYHFKAARHYHKFVAEETRLNQ